ncbi:MAG TPA: 2-C-methyl-D-erythritol 2,4-cyclodiphosphate synthase [Mycobacteriales bacterium]|nr:2-C-methyl-D-erythritol 2,4-cyclodiphosphate synthase [Mycobacteriales bacterium]
MDLTRLRIGAGHDIHTLHAGHPLILGGVTIPTDRGFNTHSDGDVLCHALIDALAGAMADGDLGTHFPEDDPDADDAYSLDFVTQFAGYIADHGYQLVNVDAFVVLGPVKLRPHIDQMRANLAQALSIDAARVSVKARSNDRLGEAGRGEAAEAWAHVLLLAPDSQ